MTDSQQPQPFRFVLEFEGELIDPQAVILDQLTTIRAEGSDEVAPFVEDDPFNALRYAIMFRAMREITSIPGVRMTGFPNYMRRPNDHGGYDEFVLPEELSQEDMQKKFDELERQARDAGDSEAE